MTNNESVIQLPDKMQFLFSPKRYKILRGGRGSGKSQSVARALLILGAQSKLRILCAREVQNSIKQSVHKLLSDMILEMGLESFYHILQTEIRGANGTEFSFSGLATHTIDSIKSFEGCDIVWCEEAQKISAKSWVTLIPTIRKDGSEIWVTYNPELETDETHVRFTINPPEDCVNVLVNWSDNPWFPSVLEKERLECKAKYPKDYDNIWEGKCKPAVEGAIYYDEMVAIENSKRLCNVPYDPSLKVHVIFDLGWNDSMSLILVQVHISEIRIIEYIEDSQKTLSHYSSMLKNKMYNWGSLWLPHDGRHKSYQTGKSAEQIMGGYGWNVKITPSTSIEEGIRVTRMVLPRIYFDSTKTKRLIECIKRYRRSINNATNEPGEPVHDEFSHGADCLRYLALNADSLTNEDYGNIRIIESSQPREDDGLYF
jgi:phage terminase large subunit